MRVDLPVPVSPITSSLNSGQSFQSFAIQSTRLYATLATAISQFVHHLKSQIAML